MFKSELSNKNQFNKLKSYCCIVIFVSIFINWASKAFAAPLSHSEVISQFEDQSK